MGTLTIRIEDKLERELARLAKRTGRTKSDLAREMIRKNIALAKLRGARREMLPLAEAAGFYTDDDIFDAVS